jgi:uncharacterized protein (TIGR02421 family)
VNKGTSTFDRDTIPDLFVRRICTRLAENKRVRRNLPKGGRVHIDRQLPFLCIYRSPTQPADAGTRRLVTSEASYLAVSGARALRTGVTRLVEGIARTLVQQFGAFLIVEVWADDGALPQSGVVTGGVLTPRFRVVSPKHGGLDPLVEKLQETLSSIKLARLRAEVEVAPTARCAPPHVPPIVSATMAREIGCHVLGLAVRPVYRNPKTGDPYPLLLRDLRRGLTRALRQTFFEFAHTYTTHRPEHFHMLGRRAVVKTVWDVDQQLAEVSDSFDFLLQVSPVNPRQAWERFLKSNFGKAPVFRYRPLPVDPVVLKRRLYDAQVERVEDPTLAHLFRKKQEELDRKITMLLDVNTERFMHGSVQTFGRVDDTLMDLARQLLDRLPSRTRDDAKGGRLDIGSVIEQARAEIEYYRRTWPQFKSAVRVRDDIASGLMVSRGSLLVSRTARIPASRVDALLQHEIGTHLLTYYNGRAQPFRQLYSGLAGYEALQEGLAVLAEYLAGGLSRPRLRLLAARVVTVRHLLDGASFIEAFRELDRAHDFERRTAFNLTLRVYRSGGLTKDALYLKGLCQVLEYLGKGGELDPLFVGKIAVDHIPIIRELQWRNVLHPAPLRPRYLEDPEAKKRLERVRTNLTVLELIER